MFDKQFNFKGRHAVRVRALSTPYNDNGDKIFDRSFDVYLLAPVIGFSYQRMEPIDRSSEEERAVFGDILMSNNADIMYVFRTLLLLDKNYIQDSQDRIKKAFGNNFTKEDEERFYSFMRGGVDILYEKIMDNVDLPEDYVNNLYDFLDEFDHRNEKLDFDLIREQCKKYE
jgi:hypothetical protein